MTQKNKKKKRSKEEPQRRTGQIIELIEIKYVARVLCWCGEILTIDSSKPITDNTCSQCGSPYKLIDAEWTEEEMKKYMKLKGIE